jgi:hypothetical protein
MSEEEIEESYQGFIRTPSINDDLPTGYQAAQNANRKPVTFRYDQPHAMKLPHWYSK